MDKKEIDQMIKSLTEICKQNNLQVSSDVILEQSMDLYISEFIKKSETYATEKQKNFLRQHGVSEVDQLTKSSATELIGKIIESSKKTN